MSFSYFRTVRFQDTDAAGVVYFANVLAICHEAYEASLAAYGIDLKAFFCNSKSAIPIVNARVDFYRPMFCGEDLIVELVPEKLSDNEFEIAYQIFISDAKNKPAAKAMTKHVCINPESRKRQILSEEMMEWLSSS
ncbi:MAG: acyl-CoA thioesterase [Okeania sp. SIO2H7]|nr:acyl-CoA thioesterase [Okeania sp. SIO2H7]